MMHHLYEFFYEIFCDIYLEAIKPILYQTSEDIRQKETLEILTDLLECGLILLHPFLPLLTEEFYKNISMEPETTPTLLQMKYPNLVPDNTTIITQFNDVYEQIIKQVKKERLTFKLSKKQTINIVIVCKDENILKIHKKFYDMIRALCWCKEITLTTDDKQPFNHKKFTTTTTKDLKIYFDWGSLHPKQITRLRNKYTKSSYEYKRIDNLYKKTIQKNDYKYNKKRRRYHK
jgi:valyl-tRNA synthetase